MGGQQEAEKFPARRERGRPAGIEKSSPRNARLAGDAPTSYFILPTSPFLFRLNNLRKFASLCG